MPIEYQVETLDSVEEEIREAYVEKEGKFFLDPDKYHELKAAPLVNKNKQLLDEKKKLSEQVKTAEKAKVGAKDDIEKIVADRDNEISELKRKNREYSIWTP